MLLKHTSSNKPYYDLNTYLGETYHKKLYKAAIDGGFTCPTRDGTLGSKGCIFCSAKGSGDFAVFSYGKGSVTHQIDEAILRLKDKAADGYIAYFQSFTNTYGPAAVCEKLYMEALSHPNVAGISIATRPDCLPQDILDVLTKCKNAYPDKFIWVELGLQTMHETTATYIRRGYPLSVMTDACQRLSQAGIPIITHIIIGLPGEDRQMLLETIAYVNSLPVFGVKLQLLHVLKDTALATDYAHGLFDVLSKECYISLVCDCIEHLRPDIVIHRVTGDGPKAETIAPIWSFHKRNVLNTLHKELKQRNSFQGKALLTAKETV